MECDSVGNTSGPHPWRLWGANPAAGQWSRPPKRSSSWWGAERLPGAIVRTDQASGEAERRYRTQRGLARLALDAAKRSEALARLEWALQQPPASDEGS